MKLKQIQKIICAAAAVCAAACAGQGGKFSTDLTDDDQGLILTAENAAKGTAAGSGIDILEGEHIVVTGNVTSGAVQVRMVRDGSDKPSVEWTFTGADEEIEYDQEPGSYMVGFTAGENKTTGTVSAVKKA
jgi:hypothetical protein